MNELKSEELRIGNFIFDNGFQVVHSIDSLGINIIYRNGAPIRTYFEIIKPIPLTPDILCNNCGFEISYTSKWQTRIELKENTSIQIQFWNEGKIFFQYKGENMRTVRYLHEVQNGIYFLTGKELEIIFKP